MDSLPIPHQVSDDHLTTLSTPELVAVRIELHEQHARHGAAVADASRFANEVMLTESPAREIAAGTLDIAHQANGVHIRNVLVVDDALRERTDYNRLRVMMSVALRGSVTCEYFTDHDRHDVFNQIMGAEDLHPSKKMRLLGLLYPKAV